MMEFTYSSSKSNEIHLSRTTIEPKVVGNVRKRLDISLTVSPLVSVVRNTDKVFNSLVAVKSDERCMKK